MKEGENVKDRYADCGVSGTGNPTQESKPPQMTTTEGCEGGSEEGGVQGGVFLEETLPQMLGGEETNAENKLTSLPCRRKTKRLFELGDFYTHPRRSVRIKSRLSKGGPHPHHREGMRTDSISDGDFINCNSHLCEPSNSMESSRLWEIGKQIGVVCRKDEEVVKEYQCLEGRDLEIMKSFEEGEKVSHLC